MFGGKLHGLSMDISKIVKKSVRFIYPDRCPMCDRIIEADRLICEDCAKDLPWIRDPFCLKCGRQIDDETQEYCPDCMRLNHIFDYGRCVFRYEGRLRDALMRMKFDNRRDYLDFFAATASVYSKSFLQRTGAEVIVPVPMHPRKRRERGFDQCRILARKISERTGLVDGSRILCRTRYTSPQKGLTMQERRDNLENVFSCPSGQMPYKKVLVLDDIYTTGATMDEMAAALKNAGAEEVYTLALCTGHGI